MSHRVPKLVSIAPPGPSQWAEVSASLRIDYIREPRWIGFPCADRAIAELDDLRPIRRDRMAGLLIEGPAGMGKTAAFEEFARRLPAAAS